MTTYPAHLPRHASALANPVTAAASLMGTASMYYSLPPVANTMATISQASQTITFAQPPKMTYGDPDLTVSAANATASSGLAVTFTAASGSCALRGMGAVHLTNTGNRTVTASQAGNGNYLAAPDVQQTITGPLSTPTTLC